MIGKNLLRRYSFLFLLILLVTLNLVVIAYFINPYPATCDEKLIYYSTINIKESASLSLDNSFNKEYNTCIFSSCISASNERGEEFYTTSPLTPLFYLPFLIIFGNDFLIAVTSIFSSLSVILIFIIAYRLSKNQVIGTLISIAFLFAPVITKWNLGLFSIVPSLTLFLLIVYVLFCSKIRSPRKYLFAGLLLGLLMFLRIQDGILLLPVMVLMIVKKEKISGYLALCVAPGAVIILSLLANNYLFGNYIFLPQIYSANFPCLQDHLSINSLQLGGIFRFLTSGDNKIGLILYHIFFFLNSSFAFPLIFVSLLFSTLNLKKNRIYLIFSLSVLLFILFVYGTRSNYYDYGVKNLHSSILRYLLYSYSLTIISTSDIFIKIFKMKRLLKFILVFMIVVMLILVLLYTINYPKNGITYYNNIKDIYKSTESYLIKNYSTKDIIVLDYNTGKIFSPAFSGVLTYDKALQNPNINATKVYDETLRVILEKKDGTNIFLILQENYAQNNHLIMLLRNKTKLEKIDHLYSFDVYKVG